MLWRKLPFTTICIMLILSFGVVNSVELFCSLFFQEIQHTSPLGASLRLLPSLIVGALANLFVGFCVDRLSARWLVAVSTLLCAIAPLLMALTNPAWSYWLTEFWAQLLSPLSADVLFTVGLVIISEVFPEETQAVAGAVFNTVSQFGQSLGVNAMQAISLGVAGSEATKGGEQGQGLDGKQTADLLRGYRASFWAMFGIMVVCVLFAVGGLRKAGKVGLKRE
jgi:nitrate/nitrite transporter NarK